MKRQSASTPGKPHQSSRRQFLAQTGKVAVASALAARAVPRVHAGEDNTIRLAIIGCGPRGCGAVGNALSAPGGPVKLVAMADLFEDKLERSHKALTDQFGDRIDVPKDRQFLGFDSIHKALDCLRPGHDVAMLTTRAAFRPLHFEYAVAKGVNIFMEKSFSADPGGIQRILRNAEIAEKKGLKVACGLQCRHSTARQALIEKIRAGAMGQVMLIRAYRMQSGGRTGPAKPDPKEFLRQIRYSGPFLWSAGGSWMENMIHQVDECCWIKDALPLEAHGLGGRSPHSTDCGQNLESYSIEYTFPDGTKALVNGRFTPKCYNEFATWIHGAKCAAKFSGNIHAPDSWMYKTQRVAEEDISWRPAPPETISPWQNEWNVLIDAIRSNRKHMEAKRSAMSNLVALMGRAAVHCGRIVTLEEALASKFLFCPNIDAADENTPAPCRADDQGRYPAPIPGEWVEI